MTGMVHWSSRGKVANRSFLHPSDIPSDMFSRWSAGRIVQDFHKKSMQNLTSLCVHFSLTSTARSHASQRCNANETRKCVAKELSGTELEPYWDHIASFLAGNACPRNSSCKDIRTGMPNQVHIRKTVSSPQQLPMSTHPGSQRCSANETSRKENAN